MTLLHNGAQSTPRKGTDFDAALRFVIQRISEEADRTGSPLDDSDKDLLEHLPSEPTNPTVHGNNSAFEGHVPTPVLRDFQYEKLCTLAKNAHKYDISTRPEARKEWAFSSAVLKLHRHPMSWLLDWAGIKVKKANALSDTFLLWTTAVFVIILLMAIALGIAHLDQGYGQTWRVGLWVAGGCVVAGIAASTYFFTRRLETSQNERTVEKYRCDLHIPGSKGINAGTSSSSR